MSESAGNDENARHQEGRFPTTQWTLIGRLQSQNRATVAKALDEIFTTYRYPLYGFLRRGGLHHEDAEDLLQDFFAKLLRTDSLRRADQDRGRLRTFLLNALSKFRINWHRDRRRSRGPEHAESDLWDEEEARYQREKHTNGETPELFYDRRWAQEIVEEASRHLRERYSIKGQLNIHDVLAPSLSLESGDGRGHDIAVLAAQLGCTENATRVSLHRLRSQFRECLLAEVALTVKDQSEIRDEVAFLVSLFERR